MATATDDYSDATRGVEVVAEAANGHEGREADLLLLIKLAVAADVDAVKVQLVYADELCTPDYRLYSLFRDQELPDEAWHAAAREAHAGGRRLYLDVFGPRSAQLAEQIGADGIKIHASDTANHSLIRAVAASGVPVVLLAGGGACAQEIASALELLAHKEVVLLHGFQGYPTGLADNQIARVALYRSRFPELRVGFADHVPFDDPMGMWFAAAAVGAGATMIEKHFTIASVLRRVDHEAALNPDQLATFVRNVRAVATALGQPDPSAEDFGMSQAEHRYRDNARKTLVAARDLHDGEVLARQDIVLKRSGHPDAVPIDPDTVVGSTLTLDVAADQPIERRALS